jgi:hypothetical protein
VLKLLLLLPLALFAFRCSPAGHVWPPGQEAAMIEQCEIVQSSDSCICAVHLLRQEHTWNDILSATGEPYQAWLQEALADCG